MLYLFIMNEFIFFSEKNKKKFMEDSWATLNDLVVTFILR
jgi:hypothetical protein